MPCAYILECADGSYYVGSTWDLERRVSEHNLGLGAAYTRRRRPVRVVWAGEFERIDAAYEFEKQVQGWSRKKRQALIDGRLGDLPGLASRSINARGSAGGSPGFETGASAPSSTNGEQSARAAPGFETGASAPSSTNGQARDEV